MAEEVPRPAKVAKLDDATGDAVAVETATPSMGCLSQEKVEALLAECPSVRVMRQTPQLVTLMTVLRDEATTCDDFVFYGDRIIRLLVEDGLEEMPHHPRSVRTPTNVNYEGLGWTLPYHQKICGVSIVRAGESMEAGLRQVCRGIMIGKILIQRNEETAMPKLFYTKLPPNIKDLTVLLLDPMLATGGSAIAAVKVLLEHGVLPERIVFINLITCPEGIRAFHSACPQVRVVTAAVDVCLDERKYILPGLGDFGDRYFGTL
eukprot:NODE_11893_length_1259_cov_6.272085.p1 GENE.NODE_11893_length_1259_cov_6.272085~~NODE_11893_length_1259_cov_6.272085.p1  ORF type:complete len:262 (+),score=80.72 NODE_11893_length_1259_cov_6.272085:96-881(+)